MANRGWIYAATAVLAFGGHATTKAQSGAGGQSDQCTPSRCTITVTVDNDDCTDPKNITVNVPLMNVAKQHKDIQMVWIFSSETPNQYQFSTAETAITFTTPPLPDADAFTDRHITGNGRKFWFKNRNSESDYKTFKYNIQLFNNGILCKRLDPSIRNGT